MQPLSAAARAANPPSLSLLPLEMRHISFNAFREEATPTYHDMLKACTGNRSLFEPEPTPVIIDRSRWGQYLSDLEAIQGQVSKNLQGQFSSIVQNKKLSTWAKGKELHELLKLLLTQRAIHQLGLEEARFGFQAMEAELKYRRGRPHIGNLVSMEGEGLLHSPEGIDFALQYLQIVDGQPEGSETPELYIKIREPDRGDLEKYRLSSDLEVRKIAEQALLSLDEALFQKQWFPFMNKWLSLMEQARRLKDSYKNALLTLAPVLFYDLEAYEAYLATNLQLNETRIDTVVAGNLEIYRFRMELFSRFDNLTCHDAICWEIFGTLISLRQEMKKGGIEFYKEFTQSLENQMPPKQLASQTPPIEQVAVVSVVKKKKKKKKGGMTVVISPPARDLSPPPSPILPRYPLAEWLRADYPFKWDKRVQDWFDLPPSQSSDYLQHAFSTKLDLILLQKPFCHLEIESIPGRLPKKHYRTIIQFTFPDDRAMLGVITLSTYADQQGTEICYHRYFSERKPNEIFGLAMEQIAKKLEHIALPEKEVFSSPILLQGDISLLSQPTDRFITLRDNVNQIKLTIFPKRVSEL